MFIVRAAKTDLKLRYWLPCPVFSRGSDSFKPDSWQPELPVSNVAQWNPFWLTGRNHPAQQISIIAIVNSQLYMVTCFAVQVCDDHSIWLVFVKFREMNTAIDAYWINCPDKEIEQNQTHHWTRQNHRTTWSCPSRASLSFEQKRKRRKTSSSQIDLNWTSKSG